MLHDKQYEIIFYEKPSGRCPVDDFLDELPVKARAKLEKWMEKLEVLGPDLPRPHADIIRGKIRELRLVFASNQYRCLYFFVGKMIIMTHGFMKKSDRVPESDIGYAERLMREYCGRAGIGE